MNSARSKKHRKILILRFSSLGDIVMATPMIRCLRTAYPEAQIDMVVREDFIDLIADNPHLDRKIGLPRSQGLEGLKKLAQELNRERYDLVYDAHQSLRTLLLMPMLTAREKCYFQKNYLRRNSALLFKLPLLRNAPRMMQKYIEPLEPHGVVWDGKGPELHISDDVAPALRIPRHSKFIGLIPSAQWEGKRWPTGKFKSLAQRFIEETPYSLLIFGGKKDDFCAQIAAGLPPLRVFNLQGKLSIREAGAVLKRCEFVVANDTGLMHMADALGIPSVLVLGPTSEELGCLPFHPLSQIVEKELWCRPCSKNGQAPCIRKKRYCLEEIETNEVYAAASQLMEGRA